MIHINICSVLEFISNTCLQDVGYIQVTHVAVTHVTFSDVCDNITGRHKRESKNKNQETKRFSTFTVSRLHHSETKKTLLDSRIKFSAKHV